MLCDCFKSRRQLKAEILVLRHEAAAARPCLDSEQFKSAPSTNWPLRGRLTQNGGRKPLKWT
jgi:hypothetical protein